LFSFHLDTFSLYHTNPEAYYFQR